MDITTLQEPSGTNGNRRNYYSWKAVLESEYNRLLRRKNCINFNNPFIIPILTAKRDGHRKTRLCYLVNEIHTSNLPEGDNCHNDRYNEDYGMHFIELVPICNDSSLDISSIRMTRTTLQSFIFFLYRMWFLTVLSTTNIVTSIRGRGLQQQQRLLCWQLHPQ